MRARVLGRPVKWTDERSGSFVSDHHGRDYDMTVEVAFDKDGLIQAMRLTGYGNLGGYCAAFGPLLPTLNVTKNIISMYRTPLLEVATKCVFTNTTLVSAYRGAGRPEGALQHGAHDGLSPPPNSASTVSNCAGAISSRRARCRSRRLPASPMTAAIFPACSRRRSSAPTSKASSSASARARSAGKLRGLGVACYVETTAAMTSEQGGIRFNADGTVTIVTGTLDYGQGHASAFAQVLTEKLGVPFERIRLLQGDSDQLVTGGGTGGSRSAMLSGTAITQASDKVIEQRQADRRACAGSLRRRHRIRRAAASSSPAPTAPSTSWRWPNGCAAASRCRRACRRRST